MSTRWVPSRTQVADRAIVLALSGLALAALETTFTGVGFWVVGTTGVLVGLLLCHLGTALRWPPAASVVLAVVVFALLGGPLCLRSEGATAVLPTPENLSTLVDQAVFGWKDVLTTLPPVDGAGPALVLPWTLGLVTGVLAGLLAAVRGGPPLLRAALPLLAPLLLLATVILMGVARPQSLLLQGAAFAVLALGWLAVRAVRAERAGRRPRSAGAEAAVVGGSVHRDGSRWVRVGAGAAMVLLASTVAVPLAGLVTGEGQRVVLRTYVEPPFDIGQYPSPLASFRRYVELPENTSDPANLYDSVLATVDGAPEGARLRIATLDAFDGTVWGAAEGTVPGSTTDTFRRVSSVIDNPVEHEQVEVGVTLGEGYAGVWLPTVGALTSLEFGGSNPGQAAQEESFRYNLATSTAVVPSGLGAGDRYETTAVVPADDVEALDAPSGLITEAAFASAFLNNQATAWAGGESEPMAQVFAIAEHLRTEGRYSDGVIASERIYHPGHGVKRLGDEFANAPIMVGNDEQYAAIMALLANNVGVPARVVLGAVVPDDGVVRGRDVQAWVELQVADGSWRTLPTETFMSTVRPAEQPPLQEQPMSGTVVPPPAPIPPPSTLAEQNDAEFEGRRVDRDEDDESSGLPGWLRAVLLYVGLPFLAAVLVVALILGAKAWRRRRRRRAERASARVVGGWHELVDHARDLGQPVPVGAGWTRREQSFRLASAAAPGLARRADGHVFGPAAPEEEAVTAFWRAVDDERRAMSSAVTRRRRWRAAVSLTTFRRPRPR